jgi:predicted NUDIX family NTP pyrophosphohydrolase
MPLWNNKDESDADKPKNLLDSEKSEVFGIDGGEVGQEPSIAHQGWVKKRTRIRQPGNVVSTQYEVLVAINMQRGYDNDDDTFPELNSWYTLEESEWFGLTEQEYFDMAAQ